MDPAGILALRDAIRHLHGCDSRRVATEHVREVAPTGEVARDGDVEMFEAVGADKTMRVYAWSDATTGTKRRFFAVLAVGKIDSAAKAVRVGKPHKRDLRPLVRHCRSCRRADRT